MESRLDTNPGALAGATGADVLDHLGDERCWQIATEPGRRATLFVRDRGSHSVERLGLLREGRP